MRGDHIDSASANDVDDGLAKGALRRRYSRYEGWAGLFVGLDKTLRGGSFVDLAQREDAKHAVMQYRGSAWGL